MNYEEFNEISRNKKLPYKRMKDINVGDVYKLSNSKYYNTVYGEKLYAECIEKVCALPITGDLKDFMERDSNLEKISNYIHSKDIFFVYEAAQTPILTKNPNFLNRNKTVQNKRKNKKKQLQKQIFRRQRSLQKRKIINIFLLKRKK